MAGVVLHRAYYIGQRGQTASTWSFAKGGRIAEGDFLREFYLFNNYEKPVGSWALLSPSWIALNSLA